jgi:hypothetical protein
VVHVLHDDSTNGATGIETKGLKKSLKANTRKAFNRVNTTDSYTWNITQNTESTAA